MTTYDVLPRRVRIGYGAGSVATGAFGTVPGLMLLPYLTDSLGIAALAAGFIVFAPKGWDINALLDLASPALREAVLLAFLDRLSRPARDG